MNSDRAFGHCQLRQHNQDCQQRISMTVVLYIKLEKFLSNCKVVNATVLELRKNFTIWVSSPILQPAWQAVTSSSDGDDRLLCPTKVGKWSAARTARDVTITCDSRDLDSNCNCLSTNRARHKAEKGLGNEMDHTNVTLRSKKKDQQSATNSLLHYYQQSQLLFAKRAEGKAQGTTPPILIGRWASAAF